MFVGFLLIVVGLISLGAAFFGFGGNIYYMLGAISLLLGFAVRFIVSKVDPEGTEQFHKDVKDFFPHGMMDCDLPVDTVNENAPAFFRILGKLRPLYDFVYKILLFLCKLLLLGDIIITTWSVLGRHIPSITDPHWSEEIVLTFMVYMAVLSATLAIRKRSHIRMTSFDKYLPKKVLTVLDLLADLAVLALGVVLLTQGMKVIDPNGNIAKFAKYSSIPTLSQTWMYLPVPIAGIGMIIFELEQVFLRLEELFVPNANNGKEAQA